LAQDVAKFSYQAPGDEAIDNVYIVDKLFLKGVNMERSLNDTNLDYVQTRHNEINGIREYIHKYHLGLQPFYFKKTFENQLKELEKPEFKADGDNVYLRMHELKQGMAQQRKLMTANQF
jgi:hypothetical protein